MYNANLQLLSVVKTTPLFQPPSQTRVIMAVGRLVGVLSLIFILQAIIESLSLLRSTKLFGLLVKVSFADIYRVTADLTCPRERFSPWEK